jgi:uncharacterized protein
MKRILNLAIISFSIISFVWISLALNIPANDGYILDQTNSLTPEQEQLIESKLYETRQTTDIEIWILIINSLSWEDIFNYSLNVAEARWVGDKEKDNGLFMLFAMDDRERRIHVWYGLEWIITDNIAKRFWDRNINPNFKNWLYFDWINNTLQDIIDYIQKDPAAIAYINSESNNTYNNGSDSNFNLLLIVWLFMTLKLLVINYDPKTKKTKITKKWRIAFVIIWAIASFIAYKLILHW